MNWQYIALKNGLEMAGEVWKTRTTEIFSRRFIKLYYKEDILSRFA